MLQFLIYLSEHLKKNQMYPRIPSKCNTMPLFVNNFTQWIAWSNETLNWKKNSYNTRVSQTWLRLSQGSWSCSQITSWCCVSIEYGRKILTRRQANTHANTWYNTGSMIDLWHFFFFHSNFFPFSNCTDGQAPISMKDRSQSVQMAVRSHTYGFLCPVTFSSCVWLTHTLVPVSSLLSVPGHEMK